MFLIRLFQVTILINVLILLSSCNSGLVGPGGETPAADTSKFIGTWASVFDTSDNPPGTKQEKIDFWCKNGDCRNPDTCVFVNDSQYHACKTDFDFYYTYTDDSLYYYLPIVGTSEKVLDEVISYTLSNDTLVFYSDPSKYCPISIRISDSINLYW
ncbi:MAG: hypothetical protein JXB48_11015 [Candidatus Latescibacteria bacterium]|nr:hypothetical protein [Candidatus Latescibacterota bacterium]